MNTLVGQTTDSKGHVRETSEYDDFFKSNEEPIKKRIVIS